MSDEPITTPMEYAQAQIELYARCTPEVKIFIQERPAEWGKTLERCMETLTGRDHEGMMEDTARRFLSEDF